MPPTGVPKGDLTDALAVPGGSIRWYKSKKFTAHCDCTDHAPKNRCRLERLTTSSKVPGREGQGRPLGFLMAWILLQNVPGDLHSHIHFTTPTRAQSEVARRLLHTVPGSEAIFRRERKKRSIANGDGYDEDSEPPYLL